MVFHEGLIGLQLGLDAIGQLKEEIRNFSVPSNSHTQYASLGCLHSECAHHLEGILGEHQHQIADNSVKGSLLVDFLLPIPALYFQLVVSAVFLHLHFGWNGAEMPANIFLGQLNHSRGEVNGQVLGLAAFDADSIGEKFAGAATYF